MASTNRGVREASVPPDQTIDAIDRLKRLLAHRSSGPIENRDEVCRLLAQAWENLDGSDAEATFAVKLCRAENMQWELPVLTFDLERHPQTVRGSTRASVHSWTVNLDRRTAVCMANGIRQISPIAPRLDLQSVGEELAQAILAGKEDRRLAWKGPGRVRVLLAEVIPDGPKPTVEGRRKRLKELMRSLLSLQGWTIDRNWIVTKQ
jgi:hypothetical protein